MPLANLGTRKDDSSKLTIAVFKQEAGSPQNHFLDYAADVPEDMVVIGGGATALCAPPYGALLTASYPNDEMSAW